MFFKQERASYRNIKEIIDMCVCLQIMDRQIPSTEWYRMLHVRSRSLQKKQRILINLGTKTERICIFYKILQDPALQNFSLFHSKPSPHKSKNSSPAKTLDFFSWWFLYGFYHPTPPLKLPLGGICFSHFCPTTEANFLEYWLQIFKNHNFIEFQWLYTLRIPP